MKNFITYIALSSMMFSCNGQEKKENITYPKEKIMNSERFDTKRFENYPDVVSMEDEKKLPPKKETLADGTVVEYSFWDNDEDGNKTYYTKTETPPPPALYKKVKDFYPSGTIYKESEAFIGQVNIEPFFGNFITKFYDHKGYLTKTVDYSDFDDKIKIKFDELLKILQREPIITEDFIQKNKELLSAGLFHDPNREKLTAETVINELKSKDSNGKILNVGSDVERKNIKISLDNNDWIVTKDVYPQGFFNYKINGNTGKIIDISYVIDGRP